MAPLQKHVVFLVSVLLLLQSGAFGMEDKKEGFFSRLFRKKPIDSKENKENISNKKLSKEPPDFKMVDMKQVDFKKQEALQGWVILGNEQSEKNSVKKVTSENEEDLIGWTYVGDENSEEYDEDDRAPR